MKLVEEDNWHIGECLMRDTYMLSRVVFFWWAWWRVG